VQHGYRRPQHWNANVGTCHGAHAPHFGTPAGRDFTAQLATTLRTQADAADEQATRVDAGDAPVLGRKRVAAGVYREALIENPTPQQRAQYAHSLRVTAGNLRDAAVDFDARVAAWQPAEPVVVAVARSSAPLVHGYSDRYRGKACASSAMGAQKGHWTRNAAAVTCEKCKAQIARDAERAAATK
jgi:hypothetical protein